MDDRVVAIFNTNDDLVEMLRIARERAMEGVSRPDRVFEMVGKPYDIDELVAIIREAAHARHTRP